MSDAKKQLEWGAAYIREQYGSPAAAEAHERAFKHYATLCSPTLAFRAWLTGRWRDWRNRRQP